MPGVSITVTASGGPGSSDAAREELRYGPDYREEVLLRDEFSEIMATTHQNYPYWQYADDAVMVFMEGMIYNRTPAETQRQLIDFAHALRSESLPETEVAGFVTGCDGDFVCVLADRASGTTAVFNDRAGRLPTYYYEDGERFVFSREMKYILHAIPEIVLDRMGIAQFMLFDCCLGSQTLFRNIRKHPPAELITIHRPVERGARSLRVTHTPLMKYSFDLAAHTPPGRADAARRASGLFMDSIVSRYNTCRERDYRITADVSGGFDTRAVIAGLEKADARADYFTTTLITGDESGIARSLTGLYGRDITVIEAEHDVSPEKMGSLIYQTDCTVNGTTTLSCWQDMSRRRELVTGKTALFMGFHGERLRSYRLPTLWQRSVFSLFTSDLVSGESIPDAAAIAGLTTGGILNAMERYFASYPERTIQGQIKRLYFDLVRNHSDVGEERTRQLFWTASPFTGSFLHAYEIENIPLEYLDISFFRKFLAEIDPKVLSLPIFGKRVDISSPAGVFVNDTLRNIWRSVKMAATRTPVTKRMLLERGALPDHEHDRRERMIIDAMGRLSGLRGLFDRSGVHDVLRRSRSDSTLSRMMTVILYFRELEKRFSSRLRVGDIQA